MRNYFLCFYFYKISVILIISIIGKAIYICFIGYSKYLVLKFLISKDLYMYYPNFLIYHKYYYFIFIGPFKCEKQFFGKITTLVSHKFSFKSLFFIIVLPTKIF